MREPPPIPEHALLAALRAGYGLDAHTVTFLPLGYDSAASVYRAEAADGRAYFVKLRRGAVNAAGLAVPRYLHAQGLAEVCAPLPTLTGALWHAFDEYALIVYPFIADAAPLRSGQAIEQWRQFGATLRRIHDMVLPPEIEALLRRDDFTPAAVGQVRELDAVVRAEAFDDPISSALADAWHAHAAQISELVTRMEGYGQRLRADLPTPLRLCHADPHDDNVLVDAGGQLWLVDWDDCMLAAKERDLMFVIGGMSPQWGTSRDAARFFEGYGPAAIDRLALAYYRANWALQDIGAFAEDVLRAAVSEATRRDALRLFLGQFEPGGMVEIALNSQVPHG